MDLLSEHEVWETWHRRCAFALLDEAERDCLTQSVAQRFLRALRRYCDHQGLSASAVQAPPAADCAHLFETHCQLHQRAEGKSYKHWLLERGDRDLDSVQSGVALLLRMVVREWLRREHKGLKEISLDAVPPGASEPLSALLAGSADEEPLPAEMAAWLEPRCEEWLRELHPVQRKVLLIRRSGRELYDPAALREHGVGKSSLYAHQHSLFEHLAKRVRDEFPGLPAVLGARIVLEALERLGERL